METFNSEEINETICETMHLSSRNFGHSTENILTSYWPHGRGRGLEGSKREAGRQGGKEAGRQGRREAGKQAYVW